MVIIFPDSLAGDDDDDDRYDRPSVSTILFPKKMACFFLSRSTTLRVHKTFIVSKNSLQLLSKEIAHATASAEYLSQKHAWGEGRLAVARLLSLVSPAGHSLVSWAAACGQLEVVEVLMNHGATAELGDEVRTVASSIIQVRVRAGDMYCCMGKLACYAYFEASFVYTLSPTFGQTTSPRGFPIVCDGNLDLTLVQ